MEEVSSSGGLTVYSATYSLGGVVEQVPSAQQERAEAKLAELETDEVPAEVTIDADGSISRLEFDLGPAVPGEQAFTVALGLSAFGRPVQIERPPSSQVTTFSELRENLTPEAP